MKYETLFGDEWKITKGREIPIVENKYLTETKQTKFPRKKNNRRWAKKYRKKYTIQVPIRAYYIIDNPPMIVCHPEIASLFKTRL